MSHVYVVTQGKGENYHISALFSDKTKAETWAAHLQFYLLPDKQPPPVWVEEWPVDKILYFSCWEENCPHSQEDKEAKGLCFRCQREEGRFQPAENTA